MEFAVAVATSTESWRVVERAEALGFEAAWFYDTQLLNPDVFIGMALAAAKTERIRLGTGVLIPSNRIEPVTANALATLNKLAPGRIDFGVGTGFTGRRTMGLKAIPLARMKTYVERVQRMLLGETIEWDFEGHSRTIGFLNADFGLINVEDPVALHISAMGPKARRLTAEMNAGWLNFGAQVESATRDLADMRSAWREAGRDDADLRATLFFLGCVLGDGEAADSERAMAQAGPWVSVTFHNLVETTEANSMARVLPENVNAALEKYRGIYSGYTPAHARYLNNHRGHLMFLREEERGLLDADMIRSLSMTGTRAELVDRLRQLRDAGYTQFAVQVVEGQEAALDDWADVFAAL
ncbi:MAG: LLM class flavin-dependent oxidoreductase [Gammaproteobacteria bacterium]|nr:LLM class flavin-dependent oxidoreductase [Gammaproteobacteria bacterium]